MTLPPRLEADIRRHPKSVAANRAALEALISLAAVVIGAHPDRVDLLPTKQFLPLAIRGLKTSRNFVDVVAVTKGQIVLGLKTGEPRQSFIDPQGITRPLRESAKGYWFSSYQREVVLTHPSDVPSVVPLVLQCFENLRARSAPSRRSDPEATTHDATQTPPDRCGRVKRGPIIRSHRALAGGGLVAIFPQDMGNYARNKLTPSEALRRLARAESDRIRFLAATRRRSGNLLAEASGCLESEVEGLAEPLLGLKCVVKRVEEIESAVAEARRLPGFDPARQAVRSGSEMRNVVVTFVAGAQPLPDTETLLSSNPRVTLLPWNCGATRAILSLYNRPARGGDVGVPDAAVQDALRDRCVEFRTTTSRSVRTLAELLRLAERF